MKSGGEIPRYTRIALDIAYSILNEDLREGTKVSGRSTLAGKYNVSPETIRRSIALLKDMEVVEVTQKSGILIKSKEKAGEFVQKFKTRKSISVLRDENRGLLKQKQELEKKIEENMDLLIEYSTQMKNSGLMNFCELEIKSNSDVIDKSIQQTEFWQNTGATIVAVRRSGDIIVSPGPYFVFSESDIIIFVGNDDILNKVNNFIHNQ